MDHFVFVFRFLFVMLLRNSCLHPNVFCLPFSTTFILIELSLYLFQERGMLWCEHCHGVIHTVLYLTVPRSVACRVRVRLQANPSSSFASRGVYSWSVLKRLQANLVRYCYMVAAVLPGK